MRLIAIGGDLRYAYLVRAARERGIDAFGMALENAGLDARLLVGAQALAQADCVVMPNPFADGMKTPLSDKIISLTDIFGYIPDGARLYLFGTDGVPDGLFARYRITDLQKDESLMCVLARQTAEGAIQSVTAKRARELYQSSICIIGYGRIARALMPMLMGFQARVTVAARRTCARDLARAANAQAVSMQELPETLMHSDIVISTPPERVLDKNIIECISPQALLLDLSSAPFGADIAAARERGITAWREPGLPGRYCPESAGRAMLQSVLDSGKEESAHAPA